MKRLKVLFIFTGLIIFGGSAVRAQSTTNLPELSFDSFSAVYYLSRDSNNVSLLTTEETIIANYSSNSHLYGITRTIPTHYQGHSANVKIQSITDVAGNRLAYKTASDTQNNLTLTIGNPAITLYGRQTFKINYQTTGVIDISGKDNQFLLDINGRGWSLPFNKVEAIVHIPGSFRDSLLADPTCYQAYQDQAYQTCSLSKQQAPGETVLTAKSNGSVQAQHTLIMKLQFAKDTFVNKKPSWKPTTNTWILLAGFLAIVAVITGINHLRRRRKVVVLKQSAEEGKDKK